VSGGAPAEPGGVRRRFEPGTTIDDLKAYMVPFALRLGYKLNTETEFVDEVLASEIEILDSTGDVYCPCRVRTGDPKADVAIVCPCIPFYRDQFSAMRKCWCGLFVRTDVEDGAELIGIVEMEAGPVEVPAFAEKELADGDVRRVKIGKRDIAVVRTMGSFYALSNLCRHAFGPLGEGFVDGYMLICPWHGWVYDMRDGTTDHPNADVVTYPVTVRDGFVWVTVDYKP
jgi:nitrite reductase/ring-hydroxylating ferredoxin subunit/ferredoxin-thioredoxin reductase catalytic subunit